LTSEIALRGRSDRSIRLERLVFDVDREIGLRTFTTITDEERKNGDSE